METPSKKLRTNDAEATSNADGTSTNTRASFTSLKDVKLKSVLNQNPSERTGSADFLVRRIPSVSRTTTASRPFPKRFTSSKTSISHRDPLKKKSVWPSDTSLNPDMEFSSSPFSDSGNPLSKSISLEDGAEVLFSIVNSKLDKILVRFFKTEQFLQNLAYKLDQLTDEHDTLRETFQSREVSSKVMRSACTQTDTINTKVNCDLPPAPEECQSIKEVFTEDQSGTSDLISTVVVEQQSVSDCDGGAEEFPDSCEYSSVQRSQPDFVGECPSTADTLNSVIVKAEPGTSISYSWTCSSEDFESSILPNTSPAELQNLEKSQSSGSLHKTFGFSQAGTVSLDSSEVNQEIADIRLSKNLAPNMEFLNQATTSNNCFCHYSASPSFGKIKGQTVKRQEWRLPLTEYNGPQFMSPSDLQALRLAHDTRPFFVRAVMRRIFQEEELVGRNARGMSNSNHKKLPLDKTKMQFIEYVSFKYYPLKDPDSMKEYQLSWSPCLHAINGIAARATQKVLREAERFNL